MPRDSRELDYEDYLTTNHRPAFDGLRGLGFLLVITAHIPSVPLFVFLQGWTAVWIFLTMSGYLVTMLMMREEKSIGRIAFGPFLIRRFFRIVPSYWVAILIYWLACYGLPPLHDTYAAFMVRLPSYLAFVPEYADTDEFSIFTHSWTVGVELKFYLLFPPVVFLMIRNANWRFAAIAIATALFTTQGSFIAEAYCAVLFGAMLALALERPRGYAFLAKLTRVPAVVPLALIAGLFALLQYSDQFTALAAVATYLLAYTIVQEATVSRVLTVLTWQAPGVSGTAFLRRLSAPLPGAPHRLHGVRRRQYDRRSSGCLCLPRAYHPGGGTPVSNDRTAWNEFWAAIAGPNEIQFSALMLASFAIFANFRLSVRTNAPNSSTLMVRGTIP